MTRTKLKKIRAALEWSLSETGRKIGYSKVQIQRYESGVSPIPENINILLKDAILKDIFRYENIFRILK